MLDDIEMEDSQMSSSSAVLASRFGYGSNSMAGVYFSDEKDGSSPFKTRSMLGMERNSSERIVDKDFFNKFADDFDDLTFPPQNA
ncbi:hypothetical protein HDV05_007990 [Chytridiales sp. JEL 0842]|nr:hypothetical protein HDV05_007990 [Chytridiales sp. JEL 0842]